MKTTLNGEGNTESNQQMKKYQFYHTVIIPNWDPEISYIETKEFKNFEEAEKYLKNELVEEEYKDNVLYEGSGCKGEAFLYKSVYFDLDGNEIEQPDEFNEEEHNYNDYFIEIVDPENPEFNNEEEEDQDE